MAGSSLFIVTSALAVRMPYLLKRSPFCKNFSFGGQNLKIGCLSNYDLLEHRKERITTNKDCWGLFTSKVGLVSDMG